MTEYCQIELTKGQVARVSPEDWEILSQHKWYAFNAGNGFYAIRKKRKTSGEYATCYMHREIMQPAAGMEVDHINRNTLDNRRNNLRVVTRGQNAMNTGIFANNTSGFKGVVRRRGGWQAFIRLSGKRHELGFFSTGEEAHAAYCAAAIKHRGEFVGAL